MLVPLLNKLVWSPTRKKKRKLFLFELMPLLHLHSNQLDHF